MSADVILPSSRVWVRFSRLVVVPLLLAPTLARAQDAARDTTPTATPALGIRAHLRRDSLALPLPAPLLPFGRLASARPDADSVAELQALALERAAQAEREDIW